MNNWRMSVQRCSGVALLALWGLLLLGLLTPGASAQDSDSDSARQRQAIPPPYLYLRRPLQIFDLPESERLDPIRRAAEQMMQKEIEQQVLQPQNYPTLMTYEYELTGPSYDAILEDARVKALETTAAKLYFDQYIIVGRELLRNYLRANGAPFIVRTENLGQRILANDLYSMRVKLSVDVRAFYRDLSFKRFLAEPNLRPVIAVCLHEVVNGRPGVNADGRQLVEQNMQEYLFRARSREMTQPPLDMDLTESPELLEQARLEAQRHGVDVLLSGSLDVEPVSRQKLLYEDYFFQKASISMKMYRVDTGELLGQVKDDYSASGTTQDEATKKVLNALTSQATSELASHLEQTWGDLMLDHGNYRLMITPLQAEQRTNVLDALRTYAKNIEIFQKAFYGGVLVLNVVLPDDETDGLEKFLRESAEPQFIVEDRGNHRLALQML